MNLKKLAEYMEEFDIDELKHFLGEKLSDLLIEWLPYDQPTYTQSNLSKMIVSLYGVNILENKEFRHRLIRCLGLKNINSFKSFLGETSENYSPKEIVDAVANTSWKDNKISKHLLNILDIDGNVFEKSVDDREAVEIVSAPESFYELLDYQFAIRQRILAYLDSGNELSKMVVRMPTGTGKTKTAMHTIIHHYNFNLSKKGLVIWVAHTKELLDQAYDTFINVWTHIGKDSVTTYKMWDKFNLPNTDFLYDGFLFCGIQKLYSTAKSNPKLFDKIIQSCVLLVVDEAHRSSAPETKKIIGELMSKPFGAKDRSLIGLTATPGRSVKSEEENLIFTSMFENKIIEIDTKLLNDLNMSVIDAANTDPEKDIIRYFQGRKILARIRREKIEYGGLSPEEMEKFKMHLSTHGYRDIDSKFLEKIAFNKARNHKILDRLLELFAQGIPTIVFACSVEHGKMLSAALTLQGVENGHVFGDMDSIGRSTVIKRFKDREDKLNILINFDVLTTGFDATNIRCVFITRPTNSIVLYSQMLGRGLRGPKMGGNTECLLIDIEDNLNRFTTESSAFNSFDEYWK